MTEDERFDLAWKGFKQRMLVDARRYRPLAISRLELLLAMLKGEQTIEDKRAAREPASNVIHLGAPTPR